MGFIVLKTAWFFHNKGDQRVWPLDQLLAKNVNPSQANVGRMFGYWNVPAFKCNSGPGVTSNEACPYVDRSLLHFCLYWVFNLKVDRSLSCEYFTSDAIYNGSAGMTLYTTCAGVGKTVAGEGRTVLGHPHQLNQSTMRAGVWTTPFFTLS
jgi:hypothetical protein